jgi:Zn-dependent M28 family amino/carboxypeptidase
MIYLQSDLNYGFSPRQKGLPTLYVQESVYRASWGRKNLSPKLFVQIQAKVDTIQSQNVTGFLPGSDPEAPAIVFCAHYDHLGQLGDAVFAGANDNASGTALMLSLARHYACLPQAQRPPYNLIFIGFGAEETGLNGSIHYAWREPQFPLDRTALVLDFDLMGYGQDGMMTVGGITYTKLFNALQRTNRQLSNPLRLKARPNAPNSDHYPFTKKGVPGLFFYALGGKSYYHDIYDRPKALTLTAFWPVRQLMLNYVRGLEASDLP